MAAPTRYQNRIEILQGTLDLLILQTLARGWQHGHGISLAIRARSGEVLSVETGSLYPALHRLEKKGWLDSEWKVSENNQRAKYYSLTKAGKKQLAAEQDRWRLLVEAVAGVLNPA
jgi:PadR family transcriptional regulator, regulatory protein PadR